MVFEYQLLYLPKDIKNTGARTYRYIRIEGEEFEFSMGFGELHTKSYEVILERNGLELSEVQPSIEIVQAICTAKPMVITARHSYR